jgi:integrase
MPALHKLTATQIKNSKPGKYNDGGGLWFQRRQDGGGQWFLRVTVHGRRREMGLGSQTYVTPKEARELAEKWRAVARQGKDPIKERERQAREAARSDYTLRHVAEEAFEARKAELKGDGKAGRWFTPLELHVLPKLGRVPIDQLDQRDIRDALAPIWHTKADTARKAMNRLNLVIKHGAALGLDVDIQAVDKAKALLGRSRHKPKHIPSVPWQDVPKFYANLTVPTVTHLALRLLILTAVRSKPVRFIHVDHIEGDVWTIPAELMKSRRGEENEFRVPLSKEAMQVIEVALPHERDGFLFPSVRKGVISDATMSRYMQRQGLEARPHGFRSSFRTWCAEATDTPREVAEAALAHSIGKKTEIAYNRTDYFEKRKSLMERWAAHVRGENAAVVKIATDRMGK